MMFRHPPWAVAGCPKWDPGPVLCHTTTYEYPLVSIQLSFCFISLATDNPTALYNYATLLLKMGRKQDSVEAFNKYRTIETDVERLTALESSLR